MLAFLVQHLMQYSLPRHDCVQMFFYQNTFLGWCGAGVGLNAILMHAASATTHVKRNLKERNEEKRNLGDAEH